MACESQFPDSLGQDEGPVFGLFSEHIREEDYSVNSRKEGGALGTPRRAGAIKTASRHERMSSHVSRSVPAKCERDQAEPKPSLSASKSDKTCPPPRRRGLS